MSQSDAAKMLNVSTRSVAAAAKVIHEGDDELVHAVERGDVAGSAAAKVAEPPWFRADELTNARLTSV